MAFSSISAILGPKDKNVLKRKKPRKVVSTPRAILGGADVRKTTRQVSRPVSTPRAVLGGADVRRTTRQTAAPKRRAPSPAKKVVRQARRRIRRQPQVAKARKVIGKVTSTTQADTLGAKLAVKFGKKEGVAPSLLAALQEQESGFNPNAVSSANAFGRTQFIPSTAKIFGVKPGSSRKAQRSQVRGAAQYLKQLGVNEDPRKALGGYFGSATQLLPSGKTYPQEVLEKTSKFRKLDKLAPKAASKVPVAKQLPGPKAGSKRFVQKLAPKGITPTSTVRTPEHNAEIGGSPTSDHLSTNKDAFAADFPDDPKISAKIARKLGIKGFKHGQNTTVFRDGYRIQLLTAPHGTGPHVHLGIKWEGSGAVGTPGGGTSIAGVAGAAAVSAAGRKGTSGGRRPSRKGGFNLQRFLKTLDVQQEPESTPPPEAPERLKKVLEERKRRARR